MKMKEKKIGIVNLNPKFALKWKFFLPKNSTKYENFVKNLL